MTMKNARSSRNGTLLPVEFFPIDCLDYLDYLDDPKECVHGILCDEDSAIGCCTFRWRRVDGAEYCLRGNIARTLFVLWLAGSEGCAAKEFSRWATRFPHYVYRLRRLGLVIETKVERTRGGWHGRYRLLSAIEHIAFSEKGTLSLGKRRLEGCFVDLVAA